MVSCGFSIFMHQMSRILCTFLLVLTGAIGSSQIFERPIYSLSSHPTLEILSIDNWEDQTVIHLMLRNERYGATFCIDSNTVLRNSLGEEEYKLIRLEGIPCCPDNYRFNSVGERILFDLVFPALPGDIRYIDLLEGCQEGCLDIRYILLDEEMNTRLNGGIKLYELGKTAAALQVFQDIMDSDYDELSPVFGTVSLYLIYLHYEMGNAKEARRVFRELQESSIIGRDEFIESARETGIIR
jgi:hypothetical protein